MRRELTPIEDTLDRASAQISRFDQRPAGPIWSPSPAAVRAPDRGGAGPSHLHWCIAGRQRFVARQTANTLLHEALLQVPHHRIWLAGARYFFYRATAGRHYVGTADTLLPETGGISDH